MNNLLGNPEMKSMLPAAPQPAITPMLHGVQIKRQTHGGAAAIEFALILPILLAVVFAIVEFSIAFYDKAVLTNASREAARAGIVRTAPKLTSRQIKDIAINYTNQHLLISFAPIAAPVSVTVKEENAASQYLPTTPNGFGDPLTVTVSYAYRGFALGWLMGALGKPVTLSATTVMWNE